MDNDLRYVEMLHQARHSGNLSCDSWESSIIAAFSWSTQYNKLGAAIIDWLDGFKDVPTFMARFLLATECVKTRICSDKESADVSLDAMLYYQNRNCPKCQGRGVIDQSQVECPFCQGVGLREMPHGSVYHAYKAIESSLEYMNSQMRFRMRGAPHPPAERILKIVIPQKPDWYNQMNECGQRTPPHPAQS